MSKDLVVRSLASRNTACLENESKGSDFMRSGLGCQDQGLLELVKSLLQPVVPLGTMDVPVGAGPFTDPRVMPLFYVHSLVSGISIINLLIVDSAIFDHGLQQGMAETGTIGSVHAFVTKAA